MMSNKTAGEVRDWSKYPKLASIFQHRPQENVYWTELSALASELCRESAQKLEDENNVPEIWKCEDGEHNEDRGQEEAKAQTWLMTRRESSPAFVLCSLERDEKTRQ
jgi:hypothetical protein